MILIIVSGKHNYVKPNYAFIDDQEMQGGGQTDVIVIDFSKEFDKFPHNGLLYKLFKCGINDITLQWLRSFLEKRVQSVVPEGEHSHSVPINLRCTPRTSAGAVNVSYFY